MSLRPGLLAEVAALCGLQPGEHVTQDMYARLPQHLRDDLEADALESIARRETPGQVA